MAEQPDSPYFPVPVRWFEIPMNSVRWGFARLSEVTQGKPEVAKERKVENPSPRSFAPDAPAGKRVGQILNERA
jgi:hypothetical protein